MGEVSHEKIHETFSKYHFFLFPTFSENYGHVIVESMLAGTPVIISDQTPWNALEKNKAGWAIPLNEIKRFQTVLLSIVNLNSIKYKELSNCAFDYSCNKIKINNIRDLYRSFIKQEY